MALRRDPALRDEVSVLVIATEELVQVIEHLRLLRIGRADSFHPIAGGLVFLDQLADGSGGDVPVLLANGTVRVQHVLSYVLAQSGGESCDVGLGLGSLLLADGGERLGYRPGKLLVEKRLHLGSLEAKQAVDAKIEFR